MVISAPRHRTRSLRCQLDHADWSTVLMVVDGSHPDLLLIKNLLILRFYER